MDVKELFDAAQSLIAAHNEAFEGPDDPGHVAEEDFLKKIKLMGGTTPERLKSLSYEEILKALPSFDGVQPVALAKDIAKTWRNSVKGTSDSTSVKRPVSSKKAERMTPEELVASFDPEEPNSPVGERLRKISKGQAFLVYSAGREVDVDRSVSLLKELKAGYPARTHFEGKRVYVVGEIPDNYADENPLYPGRPLRPDGTCDQLNRSWAGVPKIVRQFVHFALDYEDGIDPTGAGGRDRAHNALDMALSQDALKKLKDRYPEIGIEFDEAEKQGELPNLLIPLGQPVGPEQESPADPFLVGGR